MRAPECTGQAAGTQVGERGLREAACVPVQIAGQRTSLLSGCLTNWLFGSETRLNPEVLPDQETSLCQVLTWSCQGESFFNRLIVGFVQEQFDLLKIHDKIKRLNLLLLIRKDERSRQLFWKCFHVV